MAGALSGTAGSVVYSVGGNTKVGSIKEWSLSVTHNPVESTAFSENWQTYIPSIRGATGAFNGHFDNTDASQTALNNSLFNGSAITLRLFTDARYYWNIGNAYVTADNLAVTVDGDVTTEFDFVTSGIVYLRDSTISSMLDFSKSQNAINFVTRFW